MVYRTLCQVLEEMRECHKTRNFSYLMGLVEEAQTLANRMEAALDEKQEVEHYHDKAKRAKQEYEEINRELGEARKLKDETKKLEQGLKRARDQYMRETKGGTDKCGKCGSPFTECECLG